MTLYTDGIPSAAGEAALLGATPELRQLLAERGWRVTGYDRSTHLFEQLRPTSVPAWQERFVQGEWQTIRDRACYDLLLADGSLNMVPAADQPIVLERMARMLRPGGRALVRVHLTRPPRYADTVTVFQAYRRGELAGDPFTATRTQLDMLWLDPASQSVRFPVVVDALDRLHKQGLLTDREHAAYAGLAPYNRIELHYAREEQLASQAGQWFSLRRLAGGGDYADHQQHPIYELRKP